jgi:hypothetical protein
MWSMIDHGEARRVAEYHRDRTLYKDAWVLAAAYLDLRRLARAVALRSENIYEHEPDFAALRAALGEED